MLKTENSNGLMVWPLLKVLDVGGQESIFKNAASMTNTDNGLIRGQIRTMLLQRGTD